MIFDAGSVPAFCLLRRRVSTQMLPDSDAQLYSFVLSHIVSIFIVTIDTIPTDYLSANRMLAA